MTTEQNLKTKLTFGYILLIAIFSLAIIYILREVKSLRVSKDEVLVENTKIIQLSNVISELYATENYSRLALLSYNKKAAKKYHDQLDSLVIKIDLLKSTNIQNEALQQKVDTIIDLIQLKRLTFDQVRDVQQKFQNSDVFLKAQTQIKKIQTSEKTIAIDTIVEKRSFTERLMTNRTREQKERLKQENEKVIGKQKEYLDSINKATANILSKARRIDDKLLRAYYEKEALLVNRNQALSKQLETLLLEIEKIILKNSELKSEASEEIIDTVSENIAKVGILLSVIALFFGMIILRDVNKSTRYKKKLEELNVSMKNLVQQKSFLMATISHDMVSPINSLMGFSTLLKQQLKTDKHKEYLTNIEKSTEYIKNMVDDLSMFSKLEYNKVKIVKAPFNFKELLSGIVDNLKENADRKNIELLLDIHEDLNQNFNSDAFRIQQILTNVISNAIKFTHQGSVIVKAQYLKNKVQIEVIDTGIGIKIDNKEQLFDEFVQTHDTNETNYGGSGLGLNITKRLIDLLYGTISFESELGKGTVFSITIPLPVFKSNELINAKAVTYDNEKKLQNKRILVIDDDPLQLKLLQEIFEKKVNKLTTIEDGKLAKEILQQEPYHLIITDMQMPHYSGLKVIQDIRSLKKYEQTPVIALTGKIDLDDSEYHALGFNMYLKKPLNINTLYNTIYRLLRIKPQIVCDQTNSSMHKMKYTNFDLTELYNLLDYDQEAVYQILQAFIENTQSDLNKLNHAYENLNKEEIKNLAHKMLPMFRQLKIEGVIPHLLNLERDSDQLTTEALDTEIQIAIERINKILGELGKVTNP